MANDTASALLDEQRIAYTSDTVPLDKIDDASLHNQARFVSLDKQAVERYTKAMESGDEFPPIVVRRTSTGEFYVIDGNHRVAAARSANLGTFLALVADVDADQSLRLTFLANVRHGIPTSHEERVAQAIRLADAGMDYAQASDLLRVSPHTVKHEIRRRRAATRARKLNVAGFDTLPVKQQQILSTIKQDAPFIEAARATRALKLTGDQTQAFVEKVRSQSTEAEAIEVAQTFAATTPPTDGRKAPSHVTTTPHRLKMSCNNLLGVTEEDVRNGLAGMSSDERAELAELCSKTARRLAVFSDVAS